MVLAVVVVAVVGVKNKRCGSSCRLEKSGETHNIESEHNCGTTHVAVAHVLLHALFCDCKLRLQGYCPRNGKQASYLRPQSYARSTHAHIGRRLEQIA